MGWESRSPSSATRALRAAVVALVLAAPAAARDPRVAIIADSDEALARPVIAALRGAGGARVATTVHELRNGTMADPIEKGRLLAALGAGDMVVAVGDRATNFALEELEGLPIYFVGAGLLRGQDLVREEVSGILSYNVDEFLDLLASLKYRSVGVAYTPGYEGLLGRLRSGAASRGVTLVERKIASRRELAPAVRQLTAEAKLVWVMGDPLLSRGAGFDFLVEHSIASGVPLLCGSRWEVEQGALLGMEPTAAIGGQAADGLQAMVQRRFRPPAERIVPSEGQGTVLLNRPLSKRYEVTIPEPFNWSHVP